MTSQIFISIVDVISPLVTIGFGIYGTLKDTKPKKGKMTHPAKVAIWGIVISGLISTIIKIGAVNDKINEQNRTIGEQRAKIIQQNMEAIQKRHDDSMRLSFQSQVASNFDRSINSLQDLQASGNTALSSLKDITESQRKALTNNKEILHPLFPLEISGKYLIYMDSLDQPTLKELNDFQNYLLSLNDSSTLTGFYLADIRKGIFWHDWFCLATDSSNNPLFNRFNLKVIKAIFPMLSVDLHKNRDISINLYSTPINWEIDQNTKVKYSVNKTQRLIEVDFTIDEDHLTNLNSNSNIITSFYSCEEGYLECKTGRLVNSFPGVFLNYLLFNCGPQKMDSYSAVFKSNGYKKIGDEQVYTVPVKEIIKTGTR